MAVGHSVVTLVQKLLDGTLDPHQMRRLLSIGLVVLAVIYWLAKRTRRTLGQGAAGGGAAGPARTSAPRIQLKPGFHRIPVGHRVTVVTNDGVFGQMELQAASSAAAGGSSLRVLDSALPSLLEIARTCDLYLITQCSTDEAEAAVRAAVSDSGLLHAGFNPHKMLFCETEAGRGSMARQLEPSLHVDSSPTVLDALRPFVASLVAVKTPANARALAAGVQVDNLRDFFVQSQPLPERIPEVGPSA
mmetsp:Transcript_61022/g.145342  ORF Transcript_61022/g.145342 Transcript_61022/m.145342 type:complete len:246 (+) Transcript_61022:64-801(+)